MILINNKCYIIDLDKLMAWVSETPSSEKNISTVTTMSYPITNDDEVDVVEKEISESYNIPSVSLCDVDEDVSNKIKEVTPELCRVADGRHRRLDRVLEQKPVNDGV